jgi:hypothetical protein
MKNLILLFILALSINQAQAAHVSSNRASQVGLNYFKFIAHQPEATINYTKIFSDNINEANCTYYVFNIIPKGFIIVAADDCSEPILGYSTEVNYKELSTEENIKFWMENYSNQIRYIENELIPATNQITSNWEKYFNNNFANAKASKSMAYLCKTTWDQSPNYNALCPFDATANARTVTGCVATGLAQVLKYWNWPLSGNSSHSYTSSYGVLSANFGSTTYNWSKMPYTIGGANNDLATLMLHCGIAVDMNYGTAASGGSSAYSTWGANSALAAYKNYFKYKSTIHSEVKTGYTDAQWIAILKKELDLRRPMQYSGRTPATASKPNGSGHSWVCDGYDINDFMHMNWGWGGTSNGYFAIGALNPAALGTGGGTGGGFNNSNEVILGIEPMDDRYETKTGSYNLPCTFNNDVATVNTPEAAFNKINDTDYYQINLPVGYKYLIKSGVYDKYYNQALGGYTIDVDVMYKVNKAGWWNGSYDNYIDSFYAYGGEVIDYMVFPYVQYSLGSYLFHADIYRLETSGIKKLTTAELITVFPNPANEYIIVNGINLSSYDCEITNLVGQPCVSIFHPSSNQINISNLTSGVYFLNLKNNDQQITKKIVINK